MLTHTINRYKPTFRKNSEEHRYYVWLNAINKVDHPDNPYFEGSEWKVSRRRGPGVIIGYASYEEAEWDGNKCRMYELMFPNEKQNRMFGLFHEEELIEV